MPPPDPDALRRAFAAPLARAGGSVRPYDRISLTEYVRKVEIGAFQDERGVTQRIRFDIEAEVMPAPEAVAGDDVDGILSYDTLIAAVDAALAAERVNLLETLAERIAARVLAHAAAAGVSVRIGKLDRGPYVLGVEIVRTRDDVPAAAPGPDAPRPLVLCLPPGAHSSDALPGLLDRLAAAGPALLLATPEEATPRAATAAAQTRIDLLAIEQAGWLLAAYDDRLNVVATRTELDWSLRQRRIAVWAPGRIVGDATDAPPNVRPRTLAAWIGARLGARTVSVPDAVEDALAQ